MYANGNIHIFDENHNKKVIDYKDGFEEMLMLENKINICEKFITLHIGIMCVAMTKIKDFFKKAII